MKKQNWYRIKDAADGVAEIYIYGEIGTWDDEVSSIDFIKAIKAIKADVIALYINSPGGDVFEGIAIYTAILKEREKGKIIESYIDGLAASAASFIALAAERVFMAKNAMFMIHNASGLTWGTSKDHDKTSEVLQKIDQQIRDMYMQKTRMDEKEITNLMNEESWFTAEEAKDLGFVDEVTSALKAAACADPDSNIWKQFKNIPKQIIFENKIYPPVNESGEVEEKKMEKLLKLLDAVDESAAIAAVEKLQAKVADLESDNEALSKKQREYAVDKAITDGKILPSQKDFAIGLDDTQFTAFLKTAVPVDLSKKDIKEEETPGVKYEDLLNDPQKFEEVKTNQPELFQKLYDNYIERGGAL